MTEENKDKVSEYYSVRKALSVLRRDIKELKDQHENSQEISKIAKELKKLRDEVKEEDQIKELSEKMSELKERQDLLKELIRIDLIENALEEAKKDDENVKLKLIYILKEVKAK